MTVIAPGNSYLANTSHYELIQAFSNLEVLALLLRATVLRAITSYYELLRAAVMSYYELIPPPKKCISFANTVFARISESSYYLELLRSPVLTDVGRPPTVARV